MGDIYNSAVGDSFRQCEQQWQCELQYRVELEWRSSGFLILTDTEGDIVQSVLLEKEQSRTQFTTVNIAITVNN